MVRRRRNNSHTGMKRKRTNGRKRGVGRPTEYYDKVKIMDQVFALARFGMSNREIAEFYEVTPETIDYWTRSKPEFRDALQRGRVESSLQVTESLYKRAVGYTYTEVKREVKTIFDKNTKQWVEMETGRTETTKHVLPSVGACARILEARHGDKWAQVLRSRSEVTIDGNIAVRNAPNIDELMTLLTPKEREMLRRVGVKQLMAHAATNN